MPSQSLEGQAEPVLAYETRGGLVESVHRGAFALADAAGRIVASCGDIERRVFPRSAIKLIQAVPLVESGAAAAFALSEVELALACASHGGEPRHVKAVEAWLARIGCSEADLVCGAHPPSYAPAAETLLREGRKPSRLHNNCSGKHTGFLTLAKHLGAPLAGYDKEDHPVQQGVRAALAGLSGVPREAFGVGIDGCGAPNYALPLKGLATAFARIADPAGLGETRRAAILRLTSAVRAEPYFIAGTGRLCTRIIEDGFDVVPKTGAEGVYIAALPSLKLGLALKIADGARDAAQGLFVALLIALKLVPPGSALARDYVSAPILNTQGRSVGVREIEQNLVADALAGVRRN